MRLIIIGSEYAGKSTLANRILDWIKDNMGEFYPKVHGNGLHDHYVLPFIEGTGPEAEEEAAQIRAMKPTLMEKYTRYMIHYHMGRFFYLDNDHIQVDWYYAEPVYAPLYYGYGKAGEYGDRQMLVRWWDADIMHMAPDTVLIHMKASPETIRQRMAAHPNPHGILKDEHVEQVLEAFQTLFSNTMIRRHFELDTTDKTPDETFREWVRQMEPHFSENDRLRMLTHQKLNQ